MFKKALALIMTFVMLASFMVFTASAGDVTPTRLYVGEKNKSNDNLIAMYNKEKQPITVYSVNKNGTYYTLGYEKETGEYVLTFYNYTYSEPVEYGLGKYGVYCDGDLKIVVHGTVNFDLNKDPAKGTPVTDAYGIYVKGTLTIVGDKNVGGKLIVNGDKRKASTPTDSIGIYAKNVLINEVEVIANGGFAGVVANEIIAVVDAEFKSNADNDMYSAEIDPATGKKVPLFTYGIVTDIFIQGAVSSPAADCFVKVGGDVDIDSYILKNNYSGYLNQLKSEFDVNVVVYLKDFALLDEIKGEIFNGGEKFKLINKDIPSEIYTATDSPEILSVSGKEAKVIDGDDYATVGIYLDCGRAKLTFDETAVFCKLTVIQKIIQFIKRYILFGWVFGY